MSDQLNISESINKKRWRKFKSIKRGYYSFIIIISLYALSFLLPLFINSKALIVKYEGEFINGAKLLIDGGASIKLSTE